MFLNRLDNNSKQLFLNLAYSVAQSDELFSDMQKELIKNYASEMDIDNIDFNKNNFDLESELKKVQNKDYQKIILIEILAIVYSDNIMHPAEKEIIDTIVDTWNLNSSLVTVYGEWSKSLLSLQIQGEALLEVD
jgi:uncharacterized tellurite resistance protein B-like protein